MAVYKIVDCIHDSSYTLIAIHSVLEDYRLAYFLNDTLQIHLKKSSQDIKIPNMASFSVFEWYDDSLDSNWNLISNKASIEIKTKNKDLFSIYQEESIKHFLLNQFKQADYFLKIDEEASSYNSVNLITLIKSIPQIITCYLIDIESIKNKNQLNYLNNA